MQQIIKLGTGIIGCPGKRTVFVPFIEVRMRTWPVTRRKSRPTAELVPDLGRNQMRHCHGNRQSLVHGSPILCFSGGIETPHKRVKPKFPKFYIGFGGEIPGLVWDTPHRIQKSEILLQGVTKVALEKQGPLPRTNDPHAVGPGQKATFGNLVEKLYQLLAVGRITTRREGTNRRDLGQLKWQALRKQLVTETDRIVSR